MSQQKIVVSGFGGSGSSAVIDLLSEVNGCRLLGPELRIISDPDGFLDLARSLVDDWSPYKADTALKRFRRLMWLVSRRGRAPYYLQDFSRSYTSRFDKLVEDFLMQIGTIPFRGMWVGANSPFSIFTKKISKLTRHRLQPWSHRLFFASPGEGFFLASRRFFDELCVAATDATRIIIDEGYCSLQPDRVLRLLTDARLVIIHRDPRDTFVNAQKYRYQFCPRDARNFVYWYRSLMEQSRSHEPGKGVLRIQFEELVCSYDRSRRELFAFLDIPVEAHTRQRTIFDPDTSIRNIGLWRHFARREDITFIENQLSEFCVS